MSDELSDLALRMLQRPADAEHATQEILIKLLTHLAQFRGESAFATWMYRVASNHLLNQRRRDADARHTSFDALAERLAEGLASQEDGPDYPAEHYTFCREQLGSVCLCLTRQDLC